MKISRAVRLVTASASLFVLTAGCSSLTRSCTDIGAMSGVAVRVGGFPRALDAAFVGPDLVTVQVCVATTCTSSAFNGGETDTAMVDAPLTTTDPVELSVAVHSTSGVLLPATTFRVTPHVVQPNGPDCDPTAYQATLTVTPPEAVLP